MTGSRGLLLEIERTTSMPSTEPPPGFDDKAGGGLLGDLISKTGIFGDVTGLGKGPDKFPIPGMTNVGSMSVQAANVTITGSLGGLGIPDFGSMAGAGQGGSAPATQAADGGLLGFLGLGGATLGSALSGRTLVRDGSGRVLSYSTGGSGGLPVTVSPSGVEAPQGAGTYGGGIGLLGGFGSLISGGRSLASAADQGDSLSGRSAYDILAATIDARPRNALDPRLIYDYVPPGSDTTLDRTLSSFSATKVGGRFGDDYSGSMLSRVTEGASGAIEKLGDTAATTAGDVGNLATSFAKALGNIGPSNFGLGGIFGVGGAQAAETGYAIGGYTGPGGRYEPAGVVHRGEYVFSAPAVSRIGIGALEAMHSGMPGYAEGGYVGLPWALRYLDLPGYAEGGIVGAPSILAPQPVSLPPMPMLAAATAPVAASSPSLTINQAPVNITAAQGVTPEQLRAVIVQERERTIQHLVRNLHKIAGENQGRYIQM